MFMKALFDKLPFVHQTSRRPSAGGRVVIVHWDHEAVDYLIVGGKSSKIAVGDRGRVAWAGFDNPLLALAEHLRSQPSRPQRLIVLLSRPLLEQLNLTLPEADHSELPELVAAAVEQQLGDADVPPIVDFYTQPSLGAAAAGDGQHVLAFALAAPELDRLRQWSQQASLRLMAVCSRELSPLGILRRKNVAEDSLNISVHLVSGEAELAVCRGAEPVFLRLIRTAIDDPQRVAEQVWLETQRCLTILPVEFADLPQAWFVFTTCEAAWHVARSLEDRGVTIQPVDPLFGWQVEPVNPSSSTMDGSATAATEMAGGDIAAPPTDQPASDGSSTASPVRDDDGEADTDADTDVDAGTNGAKGATPVPADSSELAQQTSAANAGAAWEYLHGELPINLLAPRKAPTPPNPLHRWGAIAAAVLVVAGLGIYFLLADVSTMRTEVAELRSEVAEEKKLAAKFQEKADQVAFVETWLSDQVDWLAELNELSARLPDGELATVRRLSASANGTMARVDLSLQVAHQENIAQLENRIRSAKYQATSQRISQNADSTEYPWQFETQITFPVELPPREAYVDGKAAAQSPEQSTQKAVAESASSEPTGEPAGIEPVAGESATVEAATVEAATEESFATLPVTTVAPAESASPSDKSPGSTAEIDSPDGNRPEVGNSQDDSAEDSPEVVASTEQETP